MDGKTLPYYAGGHDKGTVRSRVGLESVECSCHAACVLESPFTGHCIGTARIDDDRSDTLPLTLIKDIFTDGHRSGLKSVLCKDGGGATWYLGRNEGEIRKACVGGFDANMCARDKEAFGVGARCWNVLLLCQGYGAVHRC